MMVLVGKAEKGGAALKQACLVEKAAEDLQQKANGLDIRTIAPFETADAVYLIATATPAPIEKKGGK